MILVFFFLTSLLRCRSMLLQFFISVLIHNLNGARWVAAHNWSSLLCEPHQFHSETHQERLPEGKSLLQICAFGVRLGAFLIYVLVFWHNASKACRKAFLSSSSSATCFSCMSLMMANNHRRLVPTCACDRVLVYPNQYEIVRHIAAGISLEHVPSVVCKICFVQVNTIVDVWRFFHNIMLQVDFRPKLSIAPLDSNTLTNVSPWINTDFFICDHCGNEVRFSSKKNNSTYQPHCWSNRLYIVHITVVPFLNKAWKFSWIQGTSGFRIAPTCLRENWPLPTGTYPDMQKWAAIAVPRQSKPPELILNVRFRQKRCIRVSVSTSVLTYCTHSMFRTWSIAMMYSRFTAHWISSMTTKREATGQHEPSPRLPRHSLSYLQMPRL